MSKNYAIASAVLGIDSYKTFHHKAYNPAVTKVMVNLTARSGKLSNITNGDDKVTFLGLQGYLKEYAEGYWQEFFDADKEEAVGAYKAMVSSNLGFEADTQHLEELHDLGYLPLEFKALPEGVAVNYKVPMMTIENTDDRFYWLPNYIETQLSSVLWSMITSATTSRQYLKVFREYAEKTGMPLEFTAFQGHDFSQRGLMGKNGMEYVGMGHLASFSGTDSLMGMSYASQYYNADPTKELVGASVNATEHSVMCSWGQESEKDLLKNLMTNIAPTGILSVVSDTWDFWKLVTEYLPELKDTIMERDGVLVIRPDSGCPVKILCGDPEAEEECVRKGLIECLWDTFGGEVNEKGYKVLNDKIGSIYGDSITLERQEQILAQLEAKGFASKVVLGIGSYTYQYVTRDTHGLALKATNVTKGDVEEAIFKDPKTDDGVKKSLKGLFVVEKSNDGYIVRDEVSRDEFNGGELQTVWKDGKFVKETSLAEIRENVLANLG